MDKWLKLLIIEHFAGHNTVISAQIKYVLDNYCDDLDIKILCYYYNGGSYKRVEDLFGICPATFYNRIAKFGNNVEILVKNLDKSMLQSSCSSDISH